MQGERVKEHRKVPFVKRNVYHNNSGVLYPLDDFRELSKAKVGDDCSIALRIRRYNLRVDSDGTVKLSVPKWWGTLRQAEFFLREKWKWVRKVRGEVLARPAATRAPAALCCARADCRADGRPDRFSRTCRACGAIWRKRAQADLCAG